MDKQQIIFEICRTAAENDDVPLGEGKFQKLTGISRHHWRGKLWRSWSEAVKDAGFVENIASQAHEPSFIILSLVRLAQKNKRFPTDPDLVMERNHDKNFPGRQAIYRLGTHNERVDLVRRYAIDYPEYKEVLTLLPAPTLEDEGCIVLSESSKEGYVYMALLKIGSGKRYKIGKAVHVERRYDQLSIQLPEDLELIHSIRTDDAYGIEAYWHKRFADKRTKGEWFNLNREDIQEFKKRRSFM